MEKISSIVLALVAALWLCACNHPESPCNPSTQNEHSKGLGAIRSLKLYNATKDAEKSYARGDARLLGVYGFSVEVPAYNGDPFAHKSEIRMIDGTGDAFCTDEEADLNRNARAYARKYNETILFMLNQAGIYLDPVLDAHR